ncbi:MAG: hypothetical protein NT075_33535 [Chloroflexi bacterium]|nr:hypothetical protein [Chloroflexota bacterium]
MSVKALNAPKLPQRSLFLDWRAPRSLPACLLVMFVAVLCFGVQSPHTAQAASNSMVQGANLDALCPLVATDEASLTLAINCVNGAGAGAYTISVTNDISFTQPSPLLTNPAATQVVIEGNGHTVDANGYGRVLTIKLTRVVIRNLTLRGGRLPLDGTRDDSGGAIQLAASFRDGGCGLTLLNSTIEDNEAPNGGGIANLCDSSGITITNSIIRNNHATLGGGIYIPTAEELFSEIVITNSQITSNRAEERGGGIFLRAGDSGSNATISDSTIASNVVVSGTGGGISVLTGNEAAITRLALHNVALTNNSASAGGGLDVDSHGATIVAVGNTTINGNWANNGNGGGLLIQGVTEFDSTNVRLINSTITNNGATAGGGIYKRDGLLTLANTLVVSNPMGGDCKLEASPGLPSRYVSDGHNLDSDGACLPADVRQPSDIPSGSANLGPLIDNGGPTLTQALLAGSQAIDAGDDAICAADLVNNVDQRGVARPQGAHCDIGAYERPALAACPYPNLVASDEASLRQAIECVNVAAVGDYTITLATDISYTQPLFPLQNPAITSLFFAGNHHTLDAAGHGRVLTLNLVQNLTLHNLTLTGGKTDANGLSPNGGGLSFNCSDGIDCHWTLLNTVVRNNQAASGGGIDYRCDASGGGALVVQDSVIRDNQASGVGGGIRYATDEESGLCSVTLRNTLVEGNQALEGGAMRILRPRVAIIDSTIRNNVATEEGGGIMARISDGFIDMTVLRSTISGNRAGLKGGGVYIESPDQAFDIKLINTTVSSNTVTNGAGGGLYLHETSGSLRISLINSTVAQNSASQGAGVQIFDQDVAESYYTSTLRLTNSLIANNLGGDCAGEAATGILFTGQRMVSYGHNLDSDSSCLTPDVRQASDLPSGTANLGPLADNGGPTLTHALLPGSQALDAGDDVVCAADMVNGLDQRGSTRPQGVHCDIGAYEAIVQTASNLFFVSAKSSGKAGNVKFRDEDILAYDASTGTWMMLFDGSDVGITKDVDAFYWRRDGSLLLSFNGPTTVPGLGPVDDSDIVQFIPTALGEQTAGTFAWYLHGLDVGLTTDGEDIDAIGFTADDHLVISTIGNFDAPNASGRDEDLFQLNNATFGNPSSGTWRQYFDGSSAGMANEDINGLWLDPTQPDLYLTVKDSFAFDNKQMDGNDIFVCTLSQVGVCTYHLFWDADQSGTSAKHLDGMGIGALPPTFSAAAQPEVSGQAEDDPANDDDIDDLDLPDTNNGLFLPLIQH